jgi:hypothetical protein
LRRDVEVILLLFEQLLIHKMGFLINILSMDYRFHSELTWRLNGQKLPGDARRTFERIIEIRDDND